MTPRELKDRLDAGERWTIVDVREPEEYQFANIGGVLIPLGELSARFDELSPDDNIVALCHHGIRSANAVAFLKSRGFLNVHNLRGGIEAWSLQVDPSIRRY